MATTEIAHAPSTTLKDLQATRAMGIENVVSAAVALAASLRLTVTLFATLIFLVFVGTLAQADHGIWYVVDHAYFRVWFAKVDLQAYERLVQMFFPVRWNLEGWHPFPGGWLIGALLAVNLVAAHTVRFKVAAKGRRLWGGLAVIAAGMLATYFVICSGMDEGLESELSPAFCHTLWQALRLGFAGLVLAGGYLLALTYGRWGRIEWSIALVLDLLLGCLAVWLFLHPSLRLDESGLRILWQLIKGGAAGGVLLAGCILVFKKRAGIVLLHSGIALLMFSELLTGISAKEGNMTIFEGQTANYSYDTRAVELAFVDRSPSDHDQVTVVPQSMLASRSAEQNISDDKLPFDVAVLRFLPNSRLRESRHSEDNPADSGTGKFTVADEIATNAGVDTDGGVDMPSVYVRLLDKQSGEPIGTYLFSTAAFSMADAGGQGRELYMPAEEIQAAGKTYDVSLRFARTYKPYTLTLKDFSFDRYEATNKAKNYSSLVRLKDRDRGVDRDVLIWMNNPLRYSGETFYQSSFDEQTEQATVLQVVANPGWMIPYVACVLVGTGMLAHFGILLTRFIRRRSEQAARLGSKLAHGAGSSSGESGLAAGQRTTAQRIAKWFPVFIVVLFAGYLYGKTKSPQVPLHEMQIHEFAKLPLAYEGRIKPFDTLARNSLQVLSGRQEVIRHDVQPSSWSEKVRQDVFHRKPKLPAISWLLDVIADTPAGDNHRVFRIDNLELLDTLDLERRPGSFRYSVNDFRKKIGEIERQAMLAAGVSKESRSLYQKKVLELANKLRLYGRLKQAFSSPQIRANREHILNDLQQTQANIDRLLSPQDTPPPHAVPPASHDGKWSMLLAAELQVLRDRVLNQPVNPATVSLSSMLDAYAKGDAREFNKELHNYQAIVADYEQSLADHKSHLASEGMARAEILRQPKIDFEAFFNQFSPFYYAAVLYLVAFVLAAVSWLGWSQPLNRAANWLLWLTFAVHTFALIGRIYISGRPPVTNLYSSAIFIGWACVLLGLVLESLYRMGIGNIVAAVIGFLTLVIAHNLSLDGDTFTVLQAVLDTQFWLATHVVCITLGYSTTFLAGMLGALYILLGHVGWALNNQQRQQLTRMIYGTLCFAIFFSFVGTVLGGLWADDSWGRFWGWDPKENGALIIVLWNALVLHARWGGMVGPRGLANLAIGGNIVTAWSWFGVNELGVGLHAYGFRDGIAWWLLLFATSQLLLIGLGMLPRSGGDRWGSPTIGSH